MRTLTDVFAPGTPALPEGLRTLQVSPARFVEPGMTVHANFTFRNLGGGTATGFRVRFRLPEGLTYLVGTARVDETPIDEHGGLTSLLQSSGASIGDVPAGGERRISLAYSVAPTIENGTPISIQAAIASFEVPLIGSNIVRLVVRSRPMLQGSGTRLSLAPIREALPGAELALGVQIHNSGQSSAHDVIVLLPVPAHTSYVAQSARVDGRASAAAAHDEPFGVARPTIVAPTLGPGATLDVAYRVRVDAALEDATPIVARASICTQELPEFALPGVTIKIPSKPSFAGDDTAFRVECDDEVMPGQRVRLTLRARNVGSARARGVKCKLALPDGLVVSPGTRCVDGAPAVDRDRDPGLFEIGDLEPNCGVDVSLSAVVRSPVADGHEFALAARVEWATGERHFERTVTVRSAPAFPGAFNGIDREAGRALTPGEPAPLRVRLENLGTDAATDARLQLEIDPGLERVRLMEGDGELTIGDDGTVVLGTLEPNARRTLRIDAVVAGAIADASSLRVRATLRTAQLPEVDLGSAAYVVASRPRFSAEASQLAPESTDLLRPNRTVACRLTLVNEGTDRGRDVRVRLQLPDELRLESVEGASRDGDTVIFGEIAAGGAEEAVVNVRLMGAIGIGDVLEVGARVTGMNVVPFSLIPMQLVTHAEAAFGEGASLTSLPAETVDAGEDIIYTLAVRNCGDGAAKRVTIRLDAPTNAVYAPGTTTVNDVPLLDFAGTSPLLVSNGLSLADVGPGVEVIARLRAIVNTPLPAGSVIDTRATVTWDDAPELIVRADAVRVRSSAALPIVDPALPFAVLDAAAGRIAPHPYASTHDALPGETTYIALPPATTVRSNGAHPNGHAVTEASRVALAPAPNGAPVATIDSIELALDLPAERLDWIVEYLEEARFPGLIGHLMVARALFPTRTGNADADAQLQSFGDVLGELVDRLFIKLRRPDAVPTRDDLETESLRASLRTALAALAHDSATAPLDDGGLQLRGSVEREQIDEFIAALEREKLVTAAPWRAIVALLGTSLRRDGVTLADVGPYRDALEAALAGLAELSPAAFEAALHEPSAVELAVEREALLRALAQQRTVPA
jgi:uncharacterized repeat protein (TIGR01451 family)